MATSVRSITSRQSDWKLIESMSFVDLDSAIHDGLNLIRRNLRDLVPFLQEMRERLHSQGRRTDLADTPKGLTWEKWVESKKLELGSLSTVRRLLAAPAEDAPVLPTQTRGKPFPKLGEIFEMSGRFFEVSQDILNNGKLPKPNKDGLIRLGLEVKEVASPALRNDRACHVFSVQPFETVPWQFLDEMIAFYSPLPNPKILDATVNEGRIWGGGMSRYRYTGMDINPAVQPDIVADNTKMPFADCSFDIVIFDSPHVGDQGESRAKFSSKYGTAVTSKNPDGEWGNLSHTFPPFLAEAKRVLRPKGLLLAKLIDYTHSSKFQFATSAFDSCAKGIRV